MPHTSLSFCFIGNALDPMNDMLMEELWLYFGEICLTPIHWGDEKMTRAFFRLLQVSKKCLRIFSDWALDLSNGVCKHRFLLRVAIRRTYIAMGERSVLPGMSHLTALASFSFFIHNNDFRVRGSDGLRRVTLNHQASIANWIAYELIRMNHGQEVTLLMYEPVAGSEHHADSYWRDIRPPDGWDQSPYLHRMTGERLRYFQHAQYKDELVADILADFREYAVHGIIISTVLMRFERDVYLLLDWEDLKDL